MLSTNTTPWRRNRSTRLGNRKDLALNVMEYFVDCTYSIFLWHSNGLITTAIRPLTPGNNACAIKIGLDQVLHFPNHAGHLVLRAKASGPDEIALRWLMLTPEVPGANLGRLLPAVELEIGRREL